ncbi:FUSC family protein [Brachybacterium sp. AOP25-B2-12]|uniref:FUSC family protein n=1 Tax=Brachybacterium sp. AOP25-B2-12 TaxID=3457710 RepID=UPI004033DF0A
MRPPLPVGTARHWSRRLLRVAPARADHIPAARIAVGVAGPLFVLLATDHLSWALFASFGAFTSIYSRYEPTRLRLRRQVLMGSVLTACVVAGSLVAHLGAASGAALTVALHLLVPPLVAGGVALLVRWRGIRPGGALFAVFAVGAVATAGASAPVWVALLVAAGSAAWCVLLGVLWHWLGEAHPDADASGLPVDLPRRDGAAEFFRYALACFLGGCAGMLSGMSSPYWAQIAAVVPLSAPRRGDQIERGLHRVIGTGLGVVLAALLLGLSAPAWLVIVFVVVLQFLTELYVLRNYSLSLLFITPMALLMVHLAHPQPVAAMLEARVVETVLGVTMGLAVVVVPVLWRRWRAAR